jgi:polyisoprenoid-binding protein YceI
MLAPEFRNDLVPANAALSQTSIWTIVKNQTQVDFQIPRVPVSNVRGSFSGITRTVIWDEKNLSKSSVEVVIPTVSVSTNSSMCDSDLKSSNSFDVKNSTMTFKSIAVTGTPEYLLAIGNLTLADITKSVTLAVDGRTNPADEDGKTYTWFLRDWHA